LKVPNLALYHFEGCPYCSRVRAAMARLDLDLELRDIHANTAWKSELVKATGKTMVPCLRIEQPGGARWMHESLDIIQYLETEVARARE
jgi:glutathione S-transferase